MISYIKESIRLLFCLTKKYYFMEALIKFLMWGLAGFLLAAFSTLFGAVLGWFVGLFFGKAILGVSESRDFRCGKSAQLLDSSEDSSAGELISKTCATQLDKP